ncbi:MAG: LITAF-like zinc ribbon domain-containing protein [Bacteroidaceae bacterium]|nr:LITAF-like zinc ribbon domain-containing protein [Bacteroidaceae bacterium]
MFCLFLICHFYFILYILDGFRSVIHQCERCGDTFSNICVQIVGCHKHCRIRLHTIATDEHNKSR